MRHLRELSDEGLTAAAARAFNLGLIDGKTEKLPISTGELFLRLFPEPCSYWAVHKRKLRLVYGAGFEISKSERFVKEVERGRNPTLSDPALRHA